MKQIIVGTYNLNHLCVQLYLREGDGAEFYLYPEKDKPPRIKVGAQGNWGEVFGRLLHELMEMQFELLQSRYRLCSDFSCDTAGVTFAFSHHILSMSCASGGVFLSQAVPDLAREWNKKKVWHG